MDCRYARAAQCYTEAVLDLFPGVRLLIVALRFAVCISNPEAPVNQTFPIPQMDSFSIYCLVSPRRIPTAADPATRPPTHRMIEWSARYCRRDQPTDLPAKLWSALFLERPNALGEVCRPPGVALQHCLQIELRVQ